MAESDGSTTAQANGPGKPSDALAGFAAQAVIIPAGPAPDVNAAIAYALGWAVGDAQIWTENGAAGNLKHLESLPEELRVGARPWNLMIQQITGLCTKLNAHLKDAGDEPDLSNPINICGNLPVDPPDPDNLDETVKKNVEQLHTGILVVLWSVEPPLGKAYLLGHEMEQMCAGPTVGKTKVKDSVDLHFPTIHGLLFALASKLPPNAAHATDNSLRMLQAYLSVKGPESAEDLLHQGWRWHEMLAGDVGGKDGLRLGDYIAAADSVTGKLRQTALQVIKRFAVWLIIALVVAIGGIVLIVVGSRAAIGAGIASVVAALGLTWKGIGEFFGRAAAAGEAELWNAEIDWAIAHRITVLREVPKARDLQRDPALQGDPPITEHLIRHKQWKANWPDVSLLKEATTNKNAVVTPVAATRDASAPDPL